RAAPHTLSLHDALPICAAPVEPLIERAGRVAEKASRGRASRLKFGLDEAAVSRLKALAKAHNVSLFKLLLLFVWVALYRQYNKRSEEHTSELQSRFDLV